MQKIASLALATAMALSMVVPTFAADITSDGGSGSTPVYLSSTDDGSLDGSPAATAMSVTVPTALPMAVSQSGDVTTADNCQITNNSYGAVRVASVTIEAGSGWNLTAFGAKETLANEKVDSNQLGFSLAIGGGTAVETDESDTSEQVLISTPVTGCYMSGVGNTSGNKVSVVYDAIVTPLSSAVTEANIANVVFVVEWDVA